jgi:hypothetical protein
MDLHCIFKSLVQTELSPAKSRLNQMLKQMTLFLVSHHSKTLAKRARLKIFKRRPLINRLNSAPHLQLWFFKIRSPRYMHLSVVHMKWKPYRLSSTRSLRTTRSAPWATSTTLSRSSCSWRSRVSTTTARGALATTTGRQCTTGEEAVAVA